RRRQAASIRPSQVVRVTTTPSVLRLVEPNATLIAIGHPALRQPQRLLACGIRRRFRNASGPESAIASHSTSAPRPTTPPTRRPAPTRPSAGGGRCDRPRTAASSTASDDAPPPRAPRPDRRARRRQPREIDGVRESFVDAVLADRAPALAIKGEPRTPLLQRIL